MKFTQVLFLVLFGGFLLFSGCEKNPASSDDNTNVKIDSVGSDARTADAYAALEDQMYFMVNNSFSSARDYDRLDFSHSSALYKEAVSLNPGNPYANFGAALTEIFGAYADSTINGTIKRWESASLGKTSGSTLFRFSIPSGTKDMGVPIDQFARNMSKMLQVSVTNPPTIAEMQTVLRDRLLPRLNYALDRFAVAEQNQNFILKITGKMQGNTKLRPVYLKLKEVYVMDAVVQWMKAVVEGFLIYQFKLDTYTPKDVVQALQQSNTTFFVLASDGLTHSGNVHTAFLASIDRIRKSVNFIKAQTENQSDDIIKNVRPSDLDTVLSYLTRIENYFNQPQTITIKNADSDGNDYTIEVDISKLFTTPPTNPKQQWFPTYTVDTAARGDILWHWQAQDYASFNFPDPTFNGLLPNMTNENLKRLLYIDETFSWQVSLWMYDNNYDGITTYDAKLRINGKTYLPKKNRYTYSWGFPSSSGSFYGYYPFYVTDNQGQSTEVVAIVNGSDVTLTLSNPAIVTYKKYQYIEGNIGKPSQNITASLSQDYFYPYQKYVNLNLINSNIYIIQRDSTNSTPSTIDTTVYSTNYYYDYKITSGKTYQYRVKIGPPRYDSPYYWWNEIYAYRDNVYSNIVSITIPY